MKNPYMPFWVDDYVRGVRRLSLEAKGLYVDMLLELWIVGKLPNDLDYIADELRINPRTFRRVFKLISSKFRVDSEFISHSRVDEERSKLNKKSEKARDSANSRWSKDANAYANAKPTQCYSDSDTEPNTDTDNKKSKPKKAAPDIDECRAYFLENKSNEAEADKFFYYYDSKGWKVGKAPMKKWKSAAAGWITRNQDNAKPKETDHQRRMREWAEKE